jgi:hypothetical protein
MLVARLQIGHSWSTISSQMLKVNILTEIKLLGTAFGFWRAMHKLLATVMAVGAQ